MSIFFAGKAEKQKLDFCSLAGLDWATNQYDPENILASVVPGTNGVAVEVATGTGTISVLPQFAASTLRFQGVS